MHTSTIVRVQSTGVPLYDVHVPGYGILIDMHMHMDSNTNNTNDSKFVLRPASAGNVLGTYAYHLIRYAYAYA
jgi:hypothetical protein